MPAYSDTQLHRLFQLAQHLLVLEPQLSAGEALAEPFLGVFGTAAICFYDAVADRVYSVGPGSVELESSTRAVYVAGQDHHEPAIGTTIRRLVVEGKVIGAIAFRGLENPQVTAEPLAALAAALHEGIRLRREAAQGGVEAEAGAFRSAIFDLLGSECKNALTTILAATGGLREAGPLRVAQLEMARMVEDEASRLGHLVSRLDWIARLDQGDVTPCLDATSLTTLVAQAVDQWSRISPDRRIRFASRKPALATLVDPELIRLALNQMIDNACKFSLPGAAVHVAVRFDTEGGASCAVVIVCSEGAPIPDQEQARIFERSYIAPEGSTFAAGSGLGLYAARRIAIAHGGTLDLDPDRTPTHCVAFRLSLPHAANWVE